LYREEQKLTFPPTSNAFFAISAEPSTVLDSSSDKTYPFFKRALVFVSENSSSFKFKKQSLFFAKAATSFAPSIAGISSPAQMPYF